MKSDKIILDACCGGRMFWFNKKHPNAIYVDKRNEEKGCIPQQKGFEIQPDIIADFKSLPFNDKSFYLVVFDPPHASVSEHSIIGKKFGTLDMATWKNEIKSGFNECWRVLKTNGVLVMKWNEASVSIAELLKVIPQEPLFGHTTAKSGKTKWLCFMKIDEKEAGR